MVLNKASSKFMKQSFDQHNREWPLATKPMRNSRPVSHYHCCSVLEVNMASGEIGGKAMQEVSNLILKELDSTDSVSLLAKQKGACGIRSWLTMH